MHVRRNLAALLAVVLAGPLLLSACGGGGSSLADPPVSSPPTSPAPTTHAAHESPEHFIRRWLNVGTQMQNTGVIAKYLAMTKGCQDCRAVATKVTDAYAAGGYYETRGVKTSRIASSVGNTFQLDATFYPTSFKTSAAATIENFQGGRETFQIRLVRRGTTWLVRSFVQVAS